MKTFSICKFQTPEGVAFRIVYSKPAELIVLFFGPNVIRWSSGLIQDNCNAPFAALESSELQQSTELTGRDFVAKVVGALGPIDSVEYSRVDLESKDIFMFLHENVVDVIFKGGHSYNSMWVIMRLLREVFEASASEAQHIWEFICGAESLTFQNGPGLR